jgi:hypothetical protein
MKLKEKRSLTEAMSSIPTKYCQVVREQLAEAIGLNGPHAADNVRRLINGNRFINLAEQEKIEKIFKQYKIDAWTGRTL